MAEAPNNAHNKRSLIRSSHICQRRREAGRNQQVEEYNHINTHTHTHTHTHTPIKLPTLVFSLSPTVYTIEWLVINQ